MYIPTTFFSTQGACITATATTIAGNGNVLTGSFVSGGFLWNYIQFTNTETSPLSASFSSSFNVLSGSTTQAKLLVVGAGGGGGGTAVYNFGDEGKWAAGGGGAGGVVYYDNFTISPGSYEISVGTGGRSGTNQLGVVIDADHSLQVSGSDGKPSYFKNKEYPYTPFTSSLVQGYGGGAGGQFFTVWAGGAGTQIRQDEIVPDRGGSGGGASRAYNSVIDVNGAESNADGFGGLDNANQGNQGGGCYVGTGAWSENGGAGGAGAGSDGVSVYSGTTSYTTAGGNGRIFNLTGTPTYYAAGGFGFADGNTGSAALGAGSLGSGGNAGGQGWSSTVVTPENGENGVVILAWKACAAQYNKYDSYTITTQNPQTLIKYKSITNVSESVKLVGWGEAVTIVAQTGSICLTEGSASIVTCPNQYSPYISQPVATNCGIYVLEQTDTLYTYIPCGQTASVNIKLSDGCEVCAVDNSITGGAFTFLDWAYPSNCGTSSISLSGSIVSDGLTLWNSYDSYNNYSAWNDASGNGNNGIISSSKVLDFNYYGLAFPTASMCLKYAETTSSLVASPSSSYTIQTYYPKWFPYPGSTSFAQAMIGTGNTSTRLIGGGSLSDVTIRYSTLTDGGVTTNYSIVVSGSNATNIINNAGLITMTLDRNTSVINAYHNATLVGSVSSSIFEFGSGSVGGITFGRAIGATQSGPSGMSNIALYNKILSPSEINQNWNYFKQFYPLVTGSCP